MKANIVKFSIPLKWRSLSSDNGKRLSLNCLQVLGALCNLTDYEKTNLILISYSSLREKCGLEALSQVSIKRYLKSLKATKIIDYEIVAKNNFNQEKKLHIKLDLERMRSILAKKGE